MKVTNLRDAQPRARRVAIGTFDGVHLGHRRVIAGSDTVLTFEPHPLAAVNPAALPKLLDSFAIKRDLIAELGVEELVVISFDREFASRSAEQFVREVLVERLGASHVAVGENFRFGHAAKGDSDFLRERSEFETRVEPLVEVAGETVSSSHVRGLVAAGEVDKAAEFLGRPYALEGEVEHGDQRGRTLGVPTANVVPEEHLVCPGHGVYAARALTEEGEHPAAISVGVRPTFDTGRGLVVEAFLLDFDGDLYRQTLRMDFLERLRGERRFDSAAELVQQMQADIARASEICSGTVSRR